MARGPLLPGDPDRIAGYRLESRIGQGGQGAVYLGREQGGRTVAVKLLHPEWLGDAAARRRFVQELAAVRRVARFCTAQVLDADTDGELPYIVSEFVDGPSLQEVVTGAGPRRGAELDRLAIGTATALTAIHEAGVVHCDFKPSNVLIAADGPRVIDFGIARALDASGTASQVIGTPAYMAPEQFTRSDARPPVDVFAWGATMAFAVNSASPFAAESGPATMYRVLQVDPDLGRLEEPLRGLVERCLAKDPAARPPARELLLAMVGARDVPPSAPTGPAAGPPAGPPTGPPAGQPIGTATAPAPRIEDGETRRILGLGAERAEPPAGPADAETVVAGRRGRTRELPEPARRRRGVLIGAIAAGVLVVAAVVVALVVLRPGAAQQYDTIPAAFAGTWSGSGRLPAEGTTVNPHVELGAGTRHAEIGAGESACASGTLELRSATDTELQMDFSSGDGCPSGLMTFDLTSADRLEMHLGAATGTSYYATLSR
jgi:hypothetical protein